MPEKVVGVKSYQRRSKSGKVIRVTAYHQKRDQAAELMKAPGRPQVAATPGQYGAGRSVPNQGVPQAKAAAKPAPAPTKQELQDATKTAERAGFKVKKPLTGKTADAVKKLQDAGHKVEPDKEKLKLRQANADKRAAAAKKVTKSDLRKATGPKTQQALTDFKKVKTEDKAADYKRRAVVAAKDVIDKAKEAEKGTTEALQKVVKSHGGHMEGLDFRFKTQESLQRKLRDKALTRGITPEEYAAKVADALRYTAIFEPDVYVKSAQDSLAELEKQGHKVVSVENSWKKGSGYSGTNVELKAPNGLSWEMQFHTPESFAFKEPTAHQMYERVRDLTLAYEERLKIYWEMVSLWDKLKQPRNWEQLGQIMDRNDAPTPLAAVAHLESLLLKLSSVNPSGKLKAGG